jgi:hypothetical protein
LDARLTKGDTMKKYYYFRVSGSFAVEIYVTEDETRRNETETLLLTDTALERFRQDIQDRLNQEYPVQNVSLDEAHLDRTENIE